MQRLQFPLRKAGNVQRLSDRLPEMRQQEAHAAIFHLQHRGQRLVNLYLVRFQRFRVIVYRRPLLRPWRLWLPLATLVPPS
ncbi:MAG TPA: hypothetical protein VGQ11_08775, partial [Candidatus Acidoferrales bacterium]|nr:hypothetical protein [Candidatus Acidoferrales bacterium]